MTAPAHDNPAALELTREEAWVVHDALLDSIQAALDEGDDTPSEIGLLRKVEADESFDHQELDSIRDALVAYLGDAPLRDRAPGRAALRGIRSALGEDPDGVENI